MHILILAIVAVGLIPSQTLAISCNNIGVAAKKTSFRVDREPGKETQLSLLTKAILKTNAINQNLYKPLENQKLAAQYLPEFKTLRIISEHGLVPAGASFRMLALHGAAAMYSNADTMAKVIRYFGDIKSKSKGKSLSKRIRAYENFLHGGVEAIDLPGHGVGPLARQVATPQEITNYLIAYLEMMKSETPDLPIFVWTRSSSGIYMERLMEQRPDLVAGAIIMSSPVPHNHLIKKAEEILMERNRKGELQVNTEGFEWVVDQMKAAHWRERSTFNSSRVLTLTGSKDVEMMPAERRFYRKNSKVNDGVKYINIVGAEHDVLRATPEYKDDQILSTLQTVSDFIKDVIEH